MLLLAVSRLGDALALDTHTAWMDIMADPTFNLAVLDIKQIRVSNSGRLDAVIGMKLPGSDIQLHLAPTVLAKLELMLERASIEQAKFRSAQ
jgi:hypothetical protein